MDANTPSHTHTLTQYIQESPIEKVSSIWLETFPLSFKRSGSPFIVSSFLKRELQSIFNKYAPFVHFLNYILAVKHSQGRQEKILTNISAMERIYHKAPHFVNAPPTHAEDAVDVIPVDCFSLLH